MKLNKFWGVTQASFWKTHPSMDEFPETGLTQKNLWMSFPEI